MRVLITGGAGFIGSHLSESLVAAGHDVAVIDNAAPDETASPRAAGSRSAKHGNVESPRVTSPRSEDPRGRLVRHRVNILQTVPLQRAFDAFEPDVVFHLAAQHSVAHALKEPAFDAETNILGTINVLEQCKRRQVERVIYTASGGTCYGENVSASPEETPLAPASPYGISKAAAENYVRCFCELSGIQTVSLRLANIYGPRQFSAGESNVIAIFLRRLCLAESLTIYGDGEQVRDYLHVDDVVRALSMCMTNRFEDPFTILNVGSGIATSVNQIAELTTAAFREWQIDAGETPAAIPVTRLDARKGELLRCFLDCRRIRQTTGWAAGIELESGIKETTQWFASELVGGVGQSSVAPK